MRLICFWCAMLGAAVRAHAQEDFYTPQTYRQNIDLYENGLFKPAVRNDITPQSTVAEPWRPAPVREPWREPNSNYQSGPSPIIPKSEPWRLPYHAGTKEQQAAILHHKQSLTSDGGFRFEYASDNGLAAGEVIEPDGSRVGAYQYKDPSGQLVKLKYRAGKDGFQSLYQPFPPETQEYLVQAHVLRRLEILEGSHLPKSPEPVAPQTSDNHYQQAYEQQRQQYQLQQEYNLQRPEPQHNWNQNQNNNDGARRDEQRSAGGQYFVQNWRPSGQEDDGQYRENEVDNQQNRGPHSFGEGYAFAFQG